MAAGGAVGLVTMTMHYTRDETTPPEVMSVTLNGVTKPWLRVGREVEPRTGLPAWLYRPCDGEAADLWVEEMPGSGE